MSNLDSTPDEFACAAGPAGGIEVLHPRDVPLGGPRAIRVRRTLPQRDRSLIGAWCFIDHYGPQDVIGDGGMDVPPHPHTGLQTASWLFSGRVEHRDSGGVHAQVRPGELNLMTAGAGICHSEVSTDAESAPILRGVQLWVALPDFARHTARAFNHFAPEPVPLSGATALVFLGELAGHRSPVPSFTPLLGAQLDLDPRAEPALDVDPAFEHGVLCDHGPVALGGTDLAVGELGYQGPGRAVLPLRNTGDSPARVLLLGGPPFGEQLVLWWNFIARSHEEVVEFRRQWQDGDARFGEVRGYEGRLDRLPAPPMPPVRLRPRR
ncbi:pirin family protein [Mycolicibacter longobardus]|uniref:Pirin n=1 Tax=Mycolicibacter longobardus TaxID=1108812 RepID=A0A1X1YEC1_9MYCO|nr:pirin family protein [Mycolicibacter longobardus]MCV7383052.1 pirin family protein [Mycolicibacter longobardus]ORW09439.1 pirin [Mycolicibacter longobardus]